MAINIQTLIQNVTPAQIGAAHKILSSDGNFYKVENSQGKFDDEGQLIEYTVRYRKGKGFSCTCEAGKHGFARCKNYCWHVRAAVACSEEEKQAMHEQEALNVAQPAAPAIVTDVDAVTLARVMRRSEEQANKPASKPAPLRSGRAFSILK